MYKFFPTRRNRSLPRVLSKNEVTRLLEATVSHRDRTLLRLIYFAGLRVSEAINLRFSDLDSDRVSIRVTGKGSKVREIPIPEDLMRTLLDRGSIYSPVPWVFPGVRPDSPMGKRTAQRIFANARDRAKITKPVGIHCLRHSYATHLIEAGVDASFVQRLLGHASIATTLIYIHTANISELDFNTLLTL